MRRPHSWAWAATDVVDAVGGSRLLDLLLVGAGGVISLLLIMKWVIQFQKHFTNLYVSENAELRKRIDVLEDDLESARIGLVNLQRESRIHIFELEDQVRVLTRQLNERKDT